MWLHGKLSNSSVHEFTQTWNINHVQKKVLCYGHTFKVILSKAQLNMEEITFFEKYMLKRKEHKI